MTILDQRFWSKVRIIPDCCWEWQAGLRKDYLGNGGYGMFNAGKGRTTHAHRLAYEELIGPIPEGLVIDHLCRNKACVNPAHMEPVTNRENILRGNGRAAKLARRTHCETCGRPYDWADNRGKRGCSECRRRIGRAAALRWKARQKAKQLGGDWRDHISPSYEGEL